MKRSNDIPSDEELLEDYIAAFLAWCNCNDINPGYVCMAMLKGHHEER
jgi:hypothetical protein